MMPAKLPKHLIKTKPRQLQNLAVGEECAVYWTSLQVGPDESMYLDPRAEIRPCDEGMFTIRVKRTMEGFHVTLIHRKRYSSPVMTWKPGEQYYKPDGQIPVLSLTEIEDASE